MAAPFAFGMKMLSYRTLVHSLQYQMMACSLECLKCWGSRDHRNSDYIRGIYSSVQSLLSFCLLTCHLSVPLTYLNHSLFSLCSLLTDTSSFVGTSFFLAAYSWVLLEYVVRLSIFIPSSLHLLWPQMGRSPPPFGVFTSFPALASKPKRVVEVHSLACVDCPASLQLAMVLIIAPLLYFLLPSWLLIPDL